MTRQEFIDLLMLLAQAFPGDRPTEELAGIYFEDLNRVSPVTFRAAVERLIKTREYRTFPKFVEIQDAVKAVQIEAFRDSTEDQGRPRHCSRCDDQGWILGDVWKGAERIESATACTCPLGQEMARARKRKYDKFQQERNHG